jgi:hypothetical protein
MPAPQKPKPGKPGLTPYEKTFDYDKDGKLDSFEKADMWDEIARDSVKKKKKPVEGTKGTDHPDPEKQ